ncbi:MAG TPA: thrombospondin type 3 repeat-containing protein [Verrucomicrobiota bacterium]|nr:thrombospondin type 3 repeat-containing protein [Verrucomicrobiota bacterium]
MTFQTAVRDMNVYASPGTGVVEGRHLATGTIEFWGYGYGTENAARFPNASDSSYDHGDQINKASGFYGSMQIHNSDLDGDGPGSAAQTLFAYNGWGATGADDIGIGHPPPGPASDWTFAHNALTWNVKRLAVLVRVDVDGDYLPDAWEEQHFGSREAPCGRPEDDPDGDGLNNAQEHAAGTDPHDPSSCLRLVSTQWTGRSLLVRFATVKGRAYVVEFRQPIKGAPWIPQATLEGTGDVVQASVCGSESSPEGFSRVRLTP